MPEFLGRAVLIKVDTAGVGGAGATWVTIGQASGGKLDRKTDIVTTTHKGSGGFTQGLPTHNSWSVSCDIVLNPADTAWAYLLTQWAQQGTAPTPTKTYVQIDRSAIGGSKDEGAAWIASLPEDFPEADKVTGSAEFTGDKALTLSP